MILGYGWVAYCAEICVSPLLGGLADVSGSVSSVRPPSGSEVFSLASVSPEEGPPELEQAKIQKRKTQHNTDSLLTYFIKIKNRS